MTQERQQQQSECCTFSGKVSRIGEVDHGTSTTDFMEEETTRKITISAANISINWDTTIPSKLYFTDTTKNRG